MSLPKHSHAAKHKARALLGQAVGGVLSAPIAALEARIARNPWIAALNSIHGPSAAQAGRLREVLDRDRALLAAQPVEPVELPAPPVLSQAALPLPAAANTPLSCEEPIRTRTMARLLAAQGHPARALAIYEYLLVQGNGDASLRAEAEQLRCAQALSCALD